MPKKVKQYPEGTYGAWLQMQINSLAMDLKYMKEEMKLDGRHLASLQRSAAKTYAKMAAMQRILTGSAAKINMTDKLDPVTEDLIEGEAEERKEDRAYTEPFASGKLDQTIKSFGVGGKEPPTPEDMVQKLTAMQAEREANKPEPKQEEKRQSRETYPPGTYGAWLQEKTQQLSGIVQNMQEKARDLDRQATDQNVKAPEGQPAYYNTDLQMSVWQVNAANVYAQMSVIQRIMENRNPPAKMTDSLPDQLVMGMVSTEAGQKAATKEFMEPFHVSMLDKTADYLGLSWKIQPGTQYTQQRVGELREAREEANQEHEAERAQQQQERQDAAKLLVENLKQSTQKSFFGKLKSFFVGNSKEYNEAFRAVQDIADGKADLKEAKEKIWKYLDLRGNKVRDHQYGRDRFDAMMSSLALVTSPEEFKDYCGTIDKARSDRSKGTYKGTIDPAKYSLQAQKYRQDAQLLDDPGRIIGEGGRYRRDYYDYLYKLQHAKTATPELEAFALEHPGVREVAREIAEQKGLKIKIPETPTDLSKEAKAKLQEQQRGALDMAKQVRGLVELEQQEQQEQRTPSRGGGGLET